MSQCLLCERPLNDPLSLRFLLSFKPYQQSVICKKCQARFKRISKDHCCKDCHQAGKYKDQLCSDCRRWRRIERYPFRNHSLYRYNDMMSQYMSRYKFQGDYRLRKVFQHEFSEFVRRFKRQVIPIPVHRSTYQRRGFNQVDGLLSRVNILKVLTTRRDQKTVPQSKKAKVDRLRLSQPFKIKDQYRDQIQGQNLTLVDDVYTTGTTMHHAVALLKAYGAESIISVTLAR